MTRVLGFDVSSTTIGYSVLDFDQFGFKLFDSGYLKPIKKGSIIERIVDTRDRINKIITKYKPDHIGIEEIVQFMQGKSTAKTIIMLTTFNRMTCLCAYDYLGKSPELFSVMTIRHGLKTGKELPKKEEIPELVAKHLGITFPYETDKKGKIKVENYDRADGIAVGLYYTMVLTGKVKSKKKAQPKPKSKGKKK